MSHTTPATHERPPRNAALGILIASVLALGGCLKPYCEADGDCATGERCHLATHTCEGRDGGADAQSGDGGLPDGGCTAVTCENPAPICDATSLQCKPCEGDPQCEAAHPDTPVCTSDGCVECTDALEHCSGDRPICDADVCRGCDGDPECIALGVDRDVCHADACVQCTDSALHCPNLTLAVCDAGTHACRPCASHDECGHQGGVCDGGTCLSEGAVLYVDETASCSGSGTRLNPFCDLPAALLPAVAGRRVIRVATGTYSAVIIENDDVWIVAPAGATVEGAGGGTPAITVRNVAAQDVTSAVLEGLTLRGSAGSGAGVHCASGEAPPSLTLVGCTVRENGGAGVRLRNCEGTLRANHVHAHTTFGVHAELASVLVADGNRIEENAGGGIFLNGSEGTLTNNLLVANGEPSAASTGGVGIANPSGPTALLFNTVADNLVGPLATSAAGIACLGGCGLVTVSSCLVTGNLGDNAGDVSADLTPRYCFIGDGNVGDPSQQNLTGPQGLLGGGDYHLSGTSICREAGEPGLGVDHDFEGAARPTPAGTDPDIGAYEAP